MIYSLCQKLTNLIFAGSVQLDSRQNSQTSLYLVTAVQVDVSLFVTRAFDLGFAAVKRRMGIV